MGTKHNDLGISLSVCLQTSLAGKRRRNNERKPLYNAFCLYLIDIFSVFMDAVDATIFMESHNKSKIGGTKHLRRCKESGETTILRHLLIGSRKSLDSAYEVATMIRGQPGLDELDFDDLYNNLKKSKGSTLKQSTAEPAHIPKGYTQAISSKVPTAPNCVSHSDEIIYAMEEIDIRWQVAMITARIRVYEEDRKLH
ncbi:hypothetical protein Tco_0162296 [Tanacetum coccineum]